MGFSILDAHPNNECINIDSNEAWFSFIFCGSHINQLDIHAYDYYSGAEIVHGKDVVYETVSALESNLNIRNGVGNGVRINIRDFAKNTAIFKDEGEYTWRAELIQEVDITNSDVDKRKYPDNMIYEGVLPGEPNFYAVVDNVPGVDYEHYLPLTPCYKDSIKPPYFLDFSDPKFEGSAYDIPITFDSVQKKSDGTLVTVVKLDDYSNIPTELKSLRPSIGSTVYVHKNKYFGAFTAVGTNEPDEIFIDRNIQSINANDYNNDVVDGCYLKVGSDYYKITSYNKNFGIVKCENGERLKSYPAGTHYAIYTSRYWTPYYYFRVHKMPVVAVTAEFNERRRLTKEYYNDTVNCAENTANGILFRASLKIKVGNDYVDVQSNGAHLAVKYHYWDIYDTEDNKLVYHTEKVYSEDMVCEVFVPFGRTYTGKVTVVTQDGITARGETDYYLPYSPEENNKRFSLRAIQNRFGGIELAWNYSYWYDGSSFLRATDFEVFRIEKKLNKVKYLGKVDCSPIGIEGVVPAASGFNWYLIDKDCDFKLKTPAGAKVNMYLVGGGCDGGSWDVQPNSKNKSFAVGQDGGEGGCFIKKSTICDDGVLYGKAKIAQRNDTKGTTLKIGDTTHKCNDVGSTKRGKVSSNTMTQTSDISVIYNDNAEDGMNGYSTPYGTVASSGGGGAACGGNRTSGGTNALSVSGITLNPAHNKGNWILIDRDDLSGETGEFDLKVPEGATVRMYLVGGGCDGTIPRHVPTPWDGSAMESIYAGGGGYVLTKTVALGGSVHCNAKIADRAPIIGDDKNGFRVDETNRKGTALTINGTTYRCDDAGATHRDGVSNAGAAKYEGGGTEYYNAKDGVSGVKTPYKTADNPEGFMGSSGGGGGMNNIYRNMLPGKGGAGAGDGGIITSTGALNGTDATSYGCGGGGGSGKEFDYAGNFSRSIGGKGMPGCIILEIVDIADAPCPEPGRGGVGAGDGGFPGEDGDNATQYGCGGGNAGYWATDSDGNYTIGNVGRGMQGCIILEIDLEGLEGGAPEQVYAVDWTAASDKEYRYIVTGCNYESAYASRHFPVDMIECTAFVDITPHFEDFYFYFLNDADVLVKTEYDLENYDVPLVEPMGRYVTSRNNPYRMVKRHNHSLALERNEKAFYRRHTWRIEGDVTLGDVTHNITHNVSPMYAKMPSVTVEPTDYDSFPVNFLFGYVDCEIEDEGGFVFNDQYMFELWKKCVFEKLTLMIKDPKGNIWTGVMNDHKYKVEYDTHGMPYTITFDFTQTRTEYNTKVMIVDDHNEYLKTAKKNHLR